MYKDLKPPAVPVLGKSKRFNSAALHIMIAKRI